MRKAVTIIAAFAAGVWALTARAATWTDPATGITWTYTVSGGQASVGGGSSSSPAVPKATTGALTIPTKINGYPVTSIGGYAFYLCWSLTSVTIPDKVTNIGTCAFVSCSDLMNMTIPDSVTSIGQCAFLSCSGLTNVVIGSGVTSIGSSAFENCSGLISFSVDARNVNYSSVNGLLLSKDGSTLICGVNGDVVIPDGVTSIGRDTFASCRSLTSVTIPDSVTNIEYSAFRFCSGLTNVVIGSGVTSIGDYAFYGCSSLTSVTISDGVTDIGDSAFANCNKLQTVTIGNGVTNIGSYMFSGCDSLMSVTLGKCVSNIGDCAFDNCTCAVSFTGMPPSGIGNVAENCVVVYPPEYAEQWKQALSQLPLKQKIIAKVYQSAIRENDPTIMDVCYCVWKIGCDGQQFVSVRALAFEEGAVPLLVDGIRSFAKVVRPETFVEDLNGNATSQNIGDNVAANVEHTLSWKVSSDWATRLAKVKFEVLASDGELLPLELRTIPASDTYGDLEFSWNAITESQVFNALLWLYADKDPGLTLSNGILKNGSTQLASGTSLSNPNATRYIFSKMGYNLLSGSVLNYVNSETRLGLSPSGARQYAYKIVEDGE